MRRLHTILLIVSLGLQLIHAGYLTPKLEGMVAEPALITGRQQETFRYWVFTWCLQTEMRRSRGLAPSAHRLRIPMS